MNSLRSAVRRLAQSPGFTVTVVLLLAIGIGAGTAIFSVLNAVLIRPLPVSAPHQLRLVHWIGHTPELNSYSGNITHAGKGREMGSSFPYPFYEAMRAQENGLAAVFAYCPLRRVTAVANGAANTIEGLMVSGNFFASYGATAAMGRPLIDSDDVSSSAPAVVITHRLWEQQFARDPNILGQSITLNQNPFTIVGVLPPTFVGPTLGDSADFYVPFCAQPALLPSRPLSSPNRWWVQVMARVEPGTNDQSIQTALTALFRQELAESNSRLPEAQIGLLDGAQGADWALRRKMAKPLLALLAAVGLVIVIACANVAGLLVARGSARQHEFAVRAALGAGRMQLLKESMAESLCLGLLSAGLGTFFATVIRAALFASPLVLPETFRFDLSMDVTVLGFAVGLSLLTALLFGLLPAFLASRVDPLTGLKMHGGGTAPRLRAVKLLATAQIALSVLLVVGAGLMVRTLSNLARVEPGFDPTQLLLFRISPGQAGYKGESLTSLYSEIRRQLGSTPGAVSVALSSQALAADSTESTGVEIPGNPNQGKDAPQTNLLVVSEGFLSTMGIPLVAGRDIGAADTVSTTPVAVINETFARRYFADKDPLGRTFVLQDGRGRSFTVVGIARDSIYASLREPVAAVMYYSYRQHERNAIHVVIRCSVPPLSLIPAVRRTLYAINQNLPISAVRTQQQIITRSLGLDRLFAILCSAMAGLALLLACIGIYGLLAYNVARRTPEIGLRMALGATTRNVASQIMQEALLLAGAGLLLGLPATYAVAKLVRSQLYGIEPGDPGTFLGAAILLAVVALVAAWIPGIQAARVNPLEALRSE